MVRSRTGCGALALALALSLGGCAESSKIYLDCEGTEALGFRGQQADPSAYHQVFILGKTHQWGSIDKITSPMFLDWNRSLALTFEDPEYHADNFSSNIKQTLSFNKVSGRLIYEAANQNTSTTRFYEFVCKRTTPIDESRP